MIKLFDFRSVRGTQKGSGAEQALEWESARTQEQCSAGVYTFSSRQTQCKQHQ